MSDSTANPGDHASRGPVQIDPPDNFLICYQQGREVFGFQLLALTYYALVANIVDKELRKFGYHIIKQHKLCCISDAFLGTDGRIRSFVAKKQTLKSHETGLVVKAARWSVADYIRREIQCETPGDSKLAEEVESIQATDDSSAHFWSAEIARALASLTDDERAALVGMAVLDKKGPELARERNCSFAKIYRDYKRAVTIMQKKLARLA